MLMKNGIRWGILCVFLLIGSASFGMFSANSRQGSDPIFSITDQGVELLNPAPDLGSEGNGSENRVRLNNLAKVLTPFLFQGRRWDGLSQTYNHRNRQYSPKVGRFLSKDRIGFSGGNNLWRFSNNPLRFTDPWGLLELLTNSQGYFLIDDWGNWKRVSQSDAEDLEKSLCIEAKHQEFVNMSQSESQFFFTGKELFKAWLVSAMLERIVPQQTMQAIMRSNQPSTTKLYRTVSVEEFNQIQSTGKFQMGPSSADGKYFAESPADAATWGNKMMGSGNFRLIEAEFPSGVANQFYRWDRLDGIGPARFGDMNQLKDATITPHQ